MRITHVHSSYVYCYTIFIFGALFSLPLVIYSSTKSNPLDFFFPLARRTFTFRFKLTNPKKSPSSLHPQCPSASLYLNLSSPCPIPSRLPSLPPRFPHRPNLPPLPVHHPLLATELLTFKTPVSPLETLLHLHSRALLPAQQQIPLLSSSTSSSTQLTHNQGKSI